VYETWAFEGNRVLRDRLVRLRARVRARVRVRVRVSLPSPSPSPNTDPNANAITNPDPTRGPNQVSRQDRARFDSIVSSALRSHFNHALEDEEITYSPLLVGALSG